MSYQNQSYRSRYGQRFHAGQNNDGLAQGHNQAQNFPQSNSHKETEETINNRMWIKLHTLH